jgi:ribulose-phosphate 3-epimerase
VQNTPSLLSLDVDVVTISPSMLAANFGRMTEELEAIERSGAKLLHIDIMDGHFVPNLSFGPGVIKSLKPLSQMIFDVHLMITNPSRYVELFIAAGADHVTIHVEIDEDLPEVFSLIRSLGCTTGISLKPGTPAETLAPYMHLVDLILVMTVEPGFGGQGFMADQLPKIREIKRMIDESGRPIHLQVDGGIGPGSAKQCVDAGANSLVAGSSVFSATGGPAQGVKDLLASCSLQ